MYFKLAWRNLWRNKRRSIITITSIMFAVIFAVFMRSIQFGSYEVMIRGMVNMYSGYIQIHQNGYWDDQSLDNTFEYSQNFEDSILQVEGVEELVPRLESFALCATDNLSKGSLVVGVNPEKEHNILKLKEQLHEGEVITVDDNSIMLSEGLATYFKLGVGDTLVLMGQGYHGMSAAGKYNIKGIVKFRSPALNESVVIMALPNAQWLYSAENRLTSLIIEKPDNADATEVAANITSYLNNSNYEVMDWQTMIPELVETIEADSAGGVMMILVLYMIITFGIFGTILMMTAERRYEFGLLISIGLQRIQLAFVVLIETVLLGFFGVLSGYVLLYPILWYFNVNPIKLTGEMQTMMEDMGFEAIMPTSLDPSIAISHALIILVIAFVLSLYPTFHLRSLKPVEAMRL